MRRPGCLRGCWPEVWEGGLAPNEVGHKRKAVDEGVKTKNSVWDMLNFTCLLNVQEVVSIVQYTGLKFRGKPCIGEINWDSSAYR